MTTQNACSTLARTLAFRYSIWSTTRPTPMASMRSLVSADIRDLLASNRALKTILLTDFLVVVSELSATVIIPWWITISGGAKAIAVFSVALAIATFFVAPAVSPFGDRICKSRQISWGLACLCLTTAAQCALSYAGVFHLGLLFAPALAQVFSRSFVGPARETVLAELTPQAQLPVAIRIRKTTQATGGILGPVLAGGAVSWVGITGALSLLCILLLFAMLVATRIPRSTPDPRSDKSVGAWWRDLQAGLAAKWLVPMERGWTIVNFAVWIFQGPAVGLLIPIKVSAMGLQGDWLGACLGALSVGVLMGSVFGSQMLVDRFGRYRVRVGLGFLEGAAIVFVGLASSGYVMIAGLVVTGFCNASMGLVGATHRALAIPKAYRVRMHAAGSMTTQVAGAIGPALVGVALGHMSVTAVYALWGALMATCVLGFLLVPRLKEFFALGHDQIADWYQRQYPTIFR